MRVNRLYFLICFGLFIASLILSIVSYLCSWGELSLGIFLSIFGGAFFAGMLSLLLFKNQKLEYAKKFFSQYNNSLNLVIKLANWFGRKKDWVKYDSHSDKYIQEFCNIVKDIRDFPMDEMYSILDDHCRLLFFLKNRVKKLMAKMLRAINNLNVAHIDREGAFSIYESGIWCERIIFEKLAPLFENKITPNNIEELNKYQQELIVLTGINKHLKKIHRDVNKENHD